MQHNYLEHDEEEVNSNFEKQKLSENMEDLSHKMAKEISKSLSRYKQTMRLLAGDAPIQVLCLDKKTENILVRHGLDRVYDLFDCDFTKIKGFGITRTRDLTTRIDEFLSMF